MGRAQNGYADDSSGWVNPSPAASRETSTPVTGAPAPEDGVEISPARVQPAGVHPEQVHTPPSVAFPEGMRRVAHAFTGAPVDHAVSDGPASVAIEPWETSGVTVLSGPMPAVSARAGEGAMLRGTVSLVLREGVLKVVVLGANVVLARVLAPRDFGIFAILGFFNVFLTTFGTFGLGPSIVQRKQAPKQSELAALFTFQILLAAALVLLAAFVAPLVAAAYHLGNEGIWLIRTMAISFLFTSSAATAMALLERRLAFGRVAAVEVLTGVLYQGIAVGMAIAGFGVWSLVFATLLSTALGGLATFAAARWRPGFSFNWRPILPMVRFGLQYQVNTFISLFSGYITPTFVAAVVGATAVGYITWATQLAYYPLMFMYIVGRVTFPVIARAVGDRVLLQRLTESAIRMQSYIIFPAVAALASLGYYLTRVIYTDKWLPALPVLYLLLISTSCASVSSALTTAMNAMGKPGTVTRLMLMWLVLNWITAVPLVLWQGYLGYAISNASVASTVIVTVVVFKRYQPIRIMSSIAAPAFSATVSGGVLYLCSRVAPPTSVIPLAIDACGIFVLFSILEFVVDRRFSSDVVNGIRALTARLGRA